VARVSRGNGYGFTTPPGRFDRLARAVGRRLENRLGGRLRTRVIVLLAAVLALSSADSATVGASATELRQALHISNTDIGLLVAVTSLVGAAASLPFGVLADRVKRTRTLAIAISVWGVAMIWSATATSFGRLLEARLFLGLVTAAAGPITASLIGDYFAAGERGRIYSYVLTGELLGAGIGFAVTGDIAALSWRAAFIILALPTFLLAWYVSRLPEPMRGATAPLADDTGQTVGHSLTEQRAGGASDETDAQRLARERGIKPDPKALLGVSRRMSFPNTVRYVLRVRTNVLLIVASACGYFYLSGVQTFGVEFSKDQFRVNQAEANAFLLLLGGGAVIGTLLSGRLSDSFLHRGFLNARILVTGVAATVATALFIPALLTRSVTAALPYLFVAAIGLSGQNPPIDAARLDIMPSFMWGRAEGIRTTLRTVSQSAAPLLFGVVSDHAFGGGREGLQAAFLVMLAPLAANAFLLLRAMKTYPQDVANAGAAGRPPQETSPFSPPGAPIQPDPAGPPPPRFLPRN
jgi:sugar phosphate permease